MFNNVNMGKDCFPLVKVIQCLGATGPTGPAGGPTARLVKSSNKDNCNFKLYSFINT